jgi:photosystem II stability/assembly factor-like uncharacterized protein
MKSESANVRKVKLTETERTSRSPRTRYRAVKGPALIWSRWNVPFAITAVAIVALVAWWAVSTYTNNDGASAGESQPIATFGTPDFHSLLVDAADPDRILFGSHAGIQESNDGGFTWKDGSLQNADAMQLSSSLNAPETIYATGHDVFQVSHDGGQTWEQRDHDLPSTDIHGFAQNADDPEQLYALAVGAGVMVSKDGGATWSLLPTQPPGGGSHTALASTDSTLFAATGEGIVASQDDGESWEALASSPSSMVISLAVSGGDPDVLYAGTPDGLSRSTDGGKTWVELGPEGVPAIALAITPTDSNRVFFIDDQGQLYRSDDAGGSWRS